MPFRCRPVGHYAKNSEVLIGSAIARRGFDRNSRGRLPSTAAVRQKVSSVMAYIMIAAAVWEARSHFGSPLFTIAGATLLLVFVGIHNACDTVTIMFFLVATRSRKPRCGKGINNDNYTPRIKTSRQGTSRLVYRNGLQVMVGESGWRKIQKWRSPTGSNSPRTRVSPFQVQRTQSAFRRHNDSKEDFTDLSSKQRANFTHCLAFQFAPS